MAQVVNRRRLPTMAELFFPRTGFWRDALLVLGGSILTTLAAQVSIPLYGQGIANPVASAITSLYAAVGIPLPSTPVPITGQTFAVVLIGALLGARLGFISLMLYLAEGLAGMPVFALAKTAWSPSSVVLLPWILGPTAGYLFGLPLAAYATGWLAERGWDRRFFSTAAAMVVGNIVIYALGVGWLSRFVGVEKAVPAGLLPFIPGDLLKILLAAVLLPTAWVALRRFRLL